MSTNFDDLLPIPNTPSTPMASVESTPQSVRSTSTPNTTSTVASSSSYSTVSPPRTLTYALDDPSNNPFADLPSTSKNFHDDSNHSSFPFSKITKEKETVNSLKGSLLQSSLDPLSSNFENLSLSSPKLESISPASTPQPSQLSNLIMTASSTTPFTSPQGSNLTSIGRSHTTLASPIDNSEIFFPSKKPPPSFLAQESSTLQDAEDAWTSYDPLLNPPASSSSTDPQPTPARIHALHVPSDLLVSANASTFSESPLFSPRPLPPASSNVSVPTSFFVSVTDPIKVSDPLNPYVIYKVTSKKMTDHPPLEYVVSRRYTEFLWVYQELLSKYPGLVIPCLPEKQAIGRFHDTFIEHRRLGLTRFLIQLANHPILAQDPQFIMFLQSETITHK
ncbi:Vacuolar protein sorting-associated protein 5, partial [Coelomomyces lativittatus]